MRMQRAGANLELTADYLGTVERIQHDPTDDLTAARLERLDENMAELYMQYPVKAWDVSEGFKPVTLSDGILHSRENVLSGSSSDTDGLARDCRGALITLGSRIPLSDTLRRSEYPVAYSLIERTLDAMRGQQYDFTPFAFRRISSQLLGEYRDSRIGYNATQLGRTTLEANIKTAFRSVGYPYGGFGHLAVFAMGLTPRQLSKIARAKD
jgi:hypothetical protein